MPLFLETWILLLVFFAIGVVVGRFIWKRS